jgi:hypothetical protein
MRDLTDGMVRFDGCSVDFTYWMALVELVHSQGSQRVSVVIIINKCDLFKNNRGLVNTPYRVQSGVTLEDLKDFVATLEDKPVDLNDKNIPGLLQLSHEFGFQMLIGKLAAHQRSPGLVGVSTKFPPAAVPLSALSKSPPTDNYDHTTISDVPLVSISLFQEGLRRDEFMFIVNHTAFLTSVVEAVVISPAVCEQLQVDSCGRRFVIYDPEIDSTDFISLQSLLLGVDTVRQKSHRKSLLRLSRQLGNVGFARFFFG